MDDDIQSMNYKPNPQGHHSRRRPSLAAPLLPLIVVEDDGRHGPPEDEVVQVELALAAFEIPVDPFQFVQLVVSPESGRASSHGSHSLGFHAVNQW
eukprot:8742221-Heterocapsa_arctica.AAC.1